MTSGDARKEFFVSYAAADERWACWVAYELALGPFGSRWPAR
jgi:hypothetical protein